jgi:hypothetical protein
VVVQRQVSREKEAVAIARTYTLQRCNPAAFLIFFYVYAGVCMIHANVHFPGGYQRTRRCETNKIENSDISTQTNGDFVLG